MFHPKGKKLPQIKFNSVEFIGNFAIALRKEMHEQYWTCKMVANAIGVSEKTVKNWLSEVNFPNGIQLLKLMNISSRICKLCLEYSTLNNGYIDIEIIKISILGNEISNEK